MGISAAKTFVLSKGEMPAESTTVDTVKAESFEDVSARARRKVQRVAVEEKKIDPIREWRAEKPGKKSSFLQDILTHNE